MEIPDDHIESDGVVLRPDGTRYLAPVRASAFLGLVRAGDRLASALNRTLERSHGIGLHAFEVLLHLVVFSDGGSLPLARLTEKAPLSQSRVSRLVADLERQGLVERTASDEDRRGVIVHVTDAGTEKFTAAQDTHLEDLDARLFSHLSDAEIEQLAGLTNRLLANDADSAEAV